MELRDFISETLIQIVQGINDAQEALKDTDCATIQEISSLKIELCKLEKNNYTLYMILISI